MTWPTPHPPLLTCRSVDIREYYDKEGALAPGSKGLSLPPAQWRALTEAMQACWLGQRGWVGGGNAGG